MKFKVLSAVTTTLFIACGEAPSSAFQEPIADGPALDRSAFRADEVERYIVVFGSDVADPRASAAELARRHNGTIVHSYVHALQGFAMIADANALEALRNHGDVFYAERDAVVGINETQTNVTWGIDRIDQMDLPLSDTYSYEVSGEGVNVYVLDTGIRTTHVEFGGRASGVFTAILDGNGGTMTRSGVSKRNP